MRVEFGFKQDSCLWEILMIGKNYNIVPFSVKANIQKSKGISECYLNRTRYPHPNVHLSQIKAVEKYMSIH